MEADNIDEFVQLDGIDGEDILKSKAWRGQLGLESTHGDGVGCVFSFYRISELALLSKVDS